MDLPTKNFGFQQKNQMCERNQEEALDFGGFHPGILIQKTRYISVSTSNEETLKVTIYALASFRK